MWGDGGGVQHHIMNIRATLYWHLNSGLRKEMEQMPARDLTLDDFLSQFATLLPVMPSVAAVVEVRLPSFFDLFPWHDFFLAAPTPCMVIA